MTQYRATQAVPRRDRINYKSTDARGETLAVMAGYVKVQQVGQSEGPIPPHTVLRGLTIADLAELQRHRDALSEQENSAITVFLASLIFSAGARVQFGGPLERRPPAPGQQLNPMEQERLRKLGYEPPPVQGPLRPNAPGIAATAVGSLAGLGVLGTTLEVIRARVVLNEQDSQIIALQREIESNPDLYGATTVLQADLLDALDAMRDAVIGTNAGGVKMPPMWLRDP